jgi:SAM-dependent methyltransferase
MSALADSNSLFDMERQLAQHQAALTVIQGMLSDPACNELSWLDLACGKGQIIAHLKENLSESERKKIRLVGYDIENANSKHAKRIAESMGMASFSFEVGSLGRFWENGSTAGPWRFITLTNTAHEIAPASLAKILAMCIDRLADDGCLFLYDMERLPNPELGAVPWSAAEMKAILVTLCRALGCSTFEPAVGRWTHKSCNGWNAQLRRAHMKLPSDYPDRIEAAIHATSDKIRELLLARLDRANTALQSLAEHGPASGEEGEEKSVLLYEFWAVSRALGETS